MSIDPNSDIGKILSDESFWRAENHKTIREKTDDLLIELDALRAKLAKIKEHLLSAKEYLDATACIQPCDSYGVCLKCSTEGDILIALMEYRGEETK